ncbi:helix-turn-helix domain-containing protein [Frankia sp. R43]
MTEVETKTSLDDVAPDPDAIKTKEDFARQLSLLRERAGLTIRNLAKRVGVPHTTVAGYFSGRHLPAMEPAESLPNLLRACGVSDPDELARWMLALRRARKSPGKIAVGGPDPYRGLATYTSDDAALFFGREQLVRSVAQRMTSSSTSGPYVILGPSGSGKSSFLRAGLLPSLLGVERGEDGALWPHVFLTPGPDPCGELRRGLSEAIGGWSAAVRGADPRGRADGAVALGSAADSTDAGPVGRDREASPVPSSAGQPRLILVVDQFEQLFRACPYPEERQAFVRLLHEIAARQVDLGVPYAPLVILAMRADFVDQALRFPTLAAALAESAIIIPAMGEPELRGAIVEPARCFGVDPEPGLVELLLREVAPSSWDDDAAAHAAGALPLLSHALLATWRRGSRRALTVADYQQVGGIQGAVARTAEDLFNGFSPAQQAVVRRLLLRLVHLDEGASHTRRRLRRAEIVDGLPEEDSRELTEILDRFVDHRLLTVDAETVEITHEALLTAWPRLGAWLDADRSGLLLHRQLTRAAREWADSARDADLLHRGTRMATTREWADEPAHRADLSPLEADFLDASVEAALAQEAARLRRTRRLHQTIAALVVLLLLVGASSGYAFHQRSQAHDQRDLALSRQVAIRAEQVRESDISLAMQLNAAAYRIAPTAEARGGLLDASAIPAATRLLGSGATGGQALATSRDGTQIAAGYTDGNIHLWKLDPQGHARLEAHLPPATGSVFALAFSPDGRVLVSGGADRSVHLWDVTDPDRPVPGGSLTLDSTVYSLSFSPDGRMLASGGAAGTVRLWGIPAGRPPVPIGSRLPGPTQDVHSVGFSPDGRTLVAGGEDKALWLYDVSDPQRPVQLGTPITGPPRSVLSVAFSPSGDTLAAGSADSGVWLWNITDVHRPVAAGAPLTDAASFVNAIVFAPDGRALLAGGSDGNARMWDLDSRAVTATLPHPQPVTAVAFARDGRSPVTGAADGTTRLWPRPAPTLAGPTGRVFTVAFAPDQRFLATSGADGAIRLFEATDSGHFSAINPPITSAQKDTTYSGAAAVSPNGRIVAAGSLQGPVHLWDITDPRKPVLLGSPLLGSTAVVESVAFSPDGRTLAVAGDDKTVRLWDVTSPHRSRLVATLTGHTQLIYQVAFSPDSALLATGSVDATVRLWDVSRPNRPVAVGAPLTEPNGSIFTVAFSPDGNLLAAGADDKTVRLWDITNPQRPTPAADPLTTSSGHPFWIAFSPDGGTLAAANTDSTIKLWGMTSSHEELATLNASSEDVLTVAFSPDGQLLAAGGLDPVIRLWQTDPERVIDYVCSVSGDPITREEWERNVPGVPYRAPCT